MDSIPPATTISASPVWVACAASDTALNPDPQTWLTVRAPTSTGSGGDGFSVYDADNAQRNLGRYDGEPKRSFIGADSVGLTGRISISCQRLPPGISEHYVLAHKVEVFGLRIGLAHQLTR